MPADMIITDKDWENATEEQRSWMLFNTMRDVNSRLERLEKRSFLVDKIYSFFGGILGGILAWLGIKIS